MWEEKFDSVPWSTVGLATLPFPNGFSKISLSNYVTSLEHIFVIFLFIFYFSPPDLTKIPLDLLTLSSAGVTLPRLFLLTYPMHTPQIG